MTNDSTLNINGYFRVKPYEMNDKGSIWAMYKDSDIN